MFGAGGGLWGGLAPPNGDALDKPRVPPARPIPLDFPEHTPECRPHPLSQRRMGELRHAILSLKRPTDNNEAVIKLLNLHLVPDTPIHNLVSTDFLPERPYMYDSDLTDMLNELKVDNDDAFREVLRQPPKEGRPKPRIAYSRNFFGNLEDISRYTDSIEDNYYDATDDDGTDADGDAEMAEASSSPTNPAKSPKKTKPMYTGRRLGNAAQLPVNTRVNAIRNLLKMVVHKFNCRDYDMSPKERLRIRDITLPPGLVMQNFVIGKLPLDRALARSRFVEGPVLGVSVRNECVFDEELYTNLLQTRDKADIGDCLGSQVDLLRETGAALAMALQRQREGKKKDAEHDRVTASWWWARKPRWGGGEMRWGMMANEVFEDEDPSWSPEERRLQMEKREKAQREMRRIEELSKKGDHLSVSDMIAKGERTAAGTNVSVSPTVGLLAEKSSGRIPTLTPTESAQGASGRGGGDGGNEKPPKKKNRMTVLLGETMEVDPAVVDSASSTTTASANSDTTATSNGDDSSSSNSSRKNQRDSTSPTTMFLPGYSRPIHIPGVSVVVNGDGSSSYQLQSRASSGSSSSISASRAAETKRKEDGEFRDGRRLMYTAPVRRKFFREWGVVRPNTSCWDERVIWRRVGAPVLEQKKEKKILGGRGGPTEEMGEQEGAAAKVMPVGLDANNNVENKQEKTGKGSQGEGKEQETVGCVDDVDDEFDEMFQLSCVNHHVALLKVRVSRRYLRWIETGEPDDAPQTQQLQQPQPGSTNAAPSPAEELGPPEASSLGNEAKRKKKKKKSSSSKRQEVTESDILQLKRSKYYDLLSVAERTEFFEGLWRVMCWVMRDEANVKSEMERVRALHEEGVVF